MFQPSQSAREYPGGSEVKEIDRNDQFRLNRHRRYITKALAGKEVGLLEVEHRILVFYRCTLILRTRPHGTAFDHGHPTRVTCGPSVKDVPERFVKDVMELDT